MARRTRFALIAAATLGVLIPVGVASSPAGAIDDDLVVDPTSGVPGTEVTVSSATCSGSSETELNLLTARLISGTGPDRVLAGVASSFDGEPASMIVPDWVDPDADAVIEAECMQLLVLDEPPYISQTTFEYTPVPFDIETGPDAPTQTATPSRSQLLSGQSFEMVGTGCPAGTDYATTEVGEGSDLTSLTIDNWVAYGEGDISGGEFALEVILNNASFSIEIIEDDDGVRVGEAVEEPNDIPDGDYVAFSLCQNEGTGSFLLLPPQRIEVTGQAPFGALDLTVPDDSRDVTFAGEECADDVRVGVLATDAEELGGFDEEPFDEPALDLALSGPSRTLALSRQAAAAGADLDGTWSALTDGDAGSERALVDDGFLDEVLPTNDGKWSVSDEVTFDQGFVEGYAICGDPLGDGFYYDPQVAVVAVEEAPPVVPPTTVPPAPPAEYVTGAPAYAG